jgi:hypothetical protein
VTRAAPYLLLIFLLIAIHLALVQFGLSPVLRGELGDTDGYTRLLRVEALASGAGWFNSALPQMNAPYGDTLNWTRPLDVLILAGALPLVAYAGMDMHAAIYWAGALSAPLLHILMALALAWAAAPLLPAAARPLVALLAAVTPIMLAYNVAGRPDQQTLLVLCIVMALGWLTRGLAGLRAVPRAGLYAGLWLGFGFWITVEAQFSYLILLVTLGLIWWWQGERRVLLLAESFAIGFFVMVAIGVLAERGPEWFSLRELDKISISHALGAALISGFIGLLAFLTREGGRGWRSLCGLSCAGAGGVALWVFVPELFLGPAGQMHPRVYNEFFLKILEMRPLWPVDAETVTLLLLWLALPLLALPLWLLARIRPVQLWLPVLAVLGFFTIAALFHARFAQVAAPLAAIVLVGAVRRYRFSLRAIALILPLTAGFVSVAASPQDTAAALRQSCNVKNIRPDLNGLPARIIMAPLGDGPALAYFTHHGAVAGPYHRNTAGLLDSFDFWGNTPDETARQIVKKRGIGYVLACLPRADRTGLVRQISLAKGVAAAPDWLEPLELPTGQGFRLYRVRD